ncbi:MAG: hypothetical protein COA46_00610 [Porticoccaceae bacterium]|nr:MAG: hypothetical protein COA46_00610 [Porticoccaceae bacterium]
MVNHISKQLINLGLLIVVLLCTTNTLADGRIVVITNVLEEVRIRISPESGTVINTGFKNIRNLRDSTPSLGVVTYEHLDCRNCATGALNYGQLTQLINPLGAEKPIKELESWSGSRAEILYRTVDNHIEKIKILP